MLAFANGCTSDPNDDAPSDAGAEAGSAGDKPVYALMATVYGIDDTRQVYVALTHSLDVDDISLDSAREFSGVANFETVGGRLLVSDGEQPLITQFDISNDLEWQDGATLDFGAFPLPDNANFFYQHLIDDHHMYMPYDGYKRIVWDPTDFEIEMTIEDSQLKPEMGDLVLEAGGNRTGIRYRNGAMMPFFYHDENWENFAPMSFIATYDPKTHEETSIIEAPCAGLAVASQDEQGNTYFSSWDYTPTLALYGIGAAPCVVRVTPKHELDEDFTTDLTQLTGGRYAMNFKYVRDGWGLADVLEADELDFDFTADTIDPAFVDELWEGGHWRVWLIDLEHQEAHPFDDVDVPGFGWSVNEIDDRTFLAVPYGIDEDTRTKIYEIDAAGKAREHLDVEGDATEWIRVR